MAKIVGLEGLSGEQISEDLRNGARFVVFSWCVSLLIVTFKRRTDIYFIRPGESPAMKSLPWTLLSFFAGWWGFPFGLIVTIPYAAALGISLVRRGRRLAATAAAATAPAASAA